MRSALTRIGDHRRRGKEIFVHLKHSALHALHVSLGARMVPFAAYDMPLSYPRGIVHEHRHTREKASLFDVSHMGQVRIHGESATQQLESLLPVDLEALSCGQQCYALLTNAAGGIRDDLMIARRAAQDYQLVVNASRKESDLDYLRDSLEGLSIEHLDSHSLLALQGPAAATVIAQWLPDIDRLPFMHCRDAELAGIACTISRCGYTGEDGFEIAVADAAARDLALALLAHPEVAPAGLGARDSLRLEAGLCLYGHELDEETTPVEAGLVWSISKSRRSGGARAGGFAGAERILAQIEAGPAKRRVGLSIKGRIPLREGAELMDASDQVVGRVSSGGFAPSLGQPIAMAYLDSAVAQVGTILKARVRSTTLEAEVVKPPFVPQRYYRP